MKKFLLLWALSACLYNCQSTTETEALSGAQAAKIYCSSCHQYPEPGLLEKASWEEHMLPRMGYMLGFYPDAETRSSLIEAGEGGQRVEAAQIYPKEPKLDEETWKEIQDFYLQQAPEKLDLPEPLAISKNLTLFQANFPATRLSPPSTTLMRFNEDGTLYLGDAHTKSLLHFDSDLGLIKAGQVQEGAVHVHDADGDLWITNMGSFSPTDAALGSVVVFPKNGKPYLPIRNLQRPVHTNYGDLDQDGQEDLVICEFGKWTGRLSWWRKTADGQYVSTTVTNRPGAIKSYLQDMNGDDQLDILALFGQGNEGIYWFDLQPDGSFVQHVVVSFPASYGSSNFRLVDANADGHFDIIYTCGDNADFGPILKPYHGIRILLNDGQQHFSEAQFIPLAGAYDAFPADFDQDGDLDLAAISFFPDFVHQPEGGFVFLENLGDFTFSAKTFPEVEAGRWIVLDAGDPDGDGDLDLALGSLAFEVIPKGEWVDRWVDKGIPMVLLENKTN